MTPAIIGKVNEGGAPFGIDVDRLIGSHACVVANSGGGKSGLLRRLLEATHGQVQHVVLDVEDEFYSLRERYSYVIAGGEGGDVPAKVAGAGTLARATLEHGFSLIAQMNDLGGAAPDFVVNFLEGLMAAPRELWRPLLIVIDEAQRFVRSGGGSIASPAVQDLLYRGRKRGFTAIVASLRISLIDPGVRGMCNNWLLGRVGQSLDRNLIADQLGFTAKEGRDKLRAIEPRLFWGFGPAIAAEPVLFRVDDVETTPVRAGQAKVPTPPAPEALRDILAGLVPPAPTSDPSIPADPTAAYQVGAAAAEMLFERDRVIEQLEAAQAKARADFVRLKRRAEAHVAALRTVQAMITAQLETEAEPETPAEPAPEPRMTSVPFKTGHKGQATDERTPARKSVAAGETALNRTAVEAAELLKAIAPDALAWNDVLLLILRRPDSGDSRKARNGLVDRGWIESTSEGVRASSVLCGEKTIDLGRWPDVADLVQAWAKKLRGPGGDILLDLFEHGQATTAEVADRLGKSPTSGWWRQGMKDLTGSRLVENERGKLSLHPLLERDRSDA